MAHLLYNDTAIRNTNRGSTWHVLEQIKAMTTARDLILQARTLNAWPWEVQKVSLQAADGLQIAGTFGIRARYQSAPDLLLGACGSVWTSLLPEWEATIEKAVDLGARPLMGFALTDCHGLPSKLLATFDLPDSAPNGVNSIKPYLLGIAGLDGKTVDQWLSTATDTVCANTLALALSNDGKGSAKVKHNGKGSDRYRSLQAGIEQAIKTGQSVALAHAEARETILTREQHNEAFDALFPPAPKDASDNAYTRAVNRRAEAHAALRMPINRRDLHEDSLQQLWNTATFLVDRKLDGEERAVKKNGDPMSALLFGERGKQVQAIQEVIYRVLGRDGSETEMTASEAVAVGAVSGADLLASMMDA